MRKLFALFIFLSVTAQAQNKKAGAQPNFIFITCEDISPYLSFYGDSTANTPYLNQLAAESLVFDQAFAPVGVCAPSRSCIITGMYPVSIGTHQMRTGKDVSGWGNRKYTYEPFQNDQQGNPYGLYSVVTPPNVKCFTTYLRKQGYYCTNNAKTDYQFAAPLSAWDENGKKAHYNNRQPNQPFFAVFNIEVTHESQIWVKANDSLRSNPNTVPLHAYWPDNEIVRKDVARNYSNIEEMDEKVGRLLAELKASGQEENTYIFFFSDHGGPLPRGKRAIYDSGLKVPFLVRVPKAALKGRTDRLISFVDIAPTVLSLAGISIPEHLQGTAFLGNQATIERSFIYGSADRFDEHYDRIRCIRDKNYLLVKNYQTQSSRYLDVAYRKQVPMMREMLRMRDAHALNDTQMLWFLPFKPEIEFYDVQADPEQVHNLADKPEYKNRIKTMLGELENWQEKIQDKGHIPEAQWVAQQWPGMKQPQTAQPKVSQKSGIYNIQCPTEGADIVYQFSNSAEPIATLDHWQLYSEPIKKTNGRYLHIRATRIGYADSEPTIVKLQ